MIEFTINQVDLLRQAIDPFADLGDRANIHFSPDFMMLQTTSPDLSVIALLLIKSESVKNFIHAEQDGCVRIEPLLLHDALNSHIDAEWSLTIYGDENIGIMHLFFQNETQAHEEGEAVEVEAYSQALLQIKCKIVSNFIHAEQDDCVGIEPLLLHDALNSHIDAEWSLTIYGDENIGLAHLFFQNETQAHEEGESVEVEVHNQGLFKTELYYNWKETGASPYGDHCLFSNIEELRPVLRHPHLKTEVCRTVLAGNPCSYGHRCHFHHALTDQEKLIAAYATNGSGGGDMNYDGAGGYMNADGCGHDERGHNYVGEYKNGGSDNKNIGYEDNDGHDDKNGDDNDGNDNNGDDKDNDGDEDDGEEDAEDDGEENAAGNEENEDNGGANEDPDMVMARHIIEMVDLNAEARQNAAPPPPPLDVEGADLHPNNDVDEGEAANYEGGEDGGVAANYEGGKDGGVAAAGNEDFDVAPPPMQHAVHENLNEELHDLEFWTDEDSDESTARS